MAQVISALGTVLRRILPKSMQRRLFLLILLVHDNGTRCQGVEQTFGSWQFHISKHMKYIEFLLDAWNNLSGCVKFRHICCWNKVLYVNTNLVTWNGLSLIASFPLLSSDAHLELLDVLELDTVIRLTMSSVQGIEKSFLNLICMVVVKAMPGKSSSVSGNFLERS